MNASRPCGNPRCLLCNPRPAPEPPSDTLAELLLATAAIVVILLVVVLVLPVVAS